MGLYDLSSQLLDYDPDEDQQTAALAALASRANPSTGTEALMPELNPSSQFPEVAEVAPDADFSQPVAPPAPDPIPAAAALAAQSQPAPAAPPPQSSFEAPPAPPQPDPYEALMQKGEEQKQRQLEQYGKDEPGVNGWALLADVVFNKGRSIPGILQQADSDKRSWREGRQKILAGGAHTDPVNQMLAMERIKNAQQANGLRGDAATTKAARDAAAAAQGKTNREGMISYLKERIPANEYESLQNVDEKTLGRLLPQINREYNITPEMSERKATSEGTIAAGRTHGRNTQNAEDAEQLEDAAYGRRKGSARAEAEYLPEKPETPSEKANRERQEQILAGQDADRKWRRQKEVDDVTRKDANDREDFITGFNKNTGSAQSALRTANRITEALDANPGLVGLENSPTEAVASSVLGEGPVQKMRGLKAAMSKDPKVKQNQDLMIRLRADYSKLLADDLKDATGVVASLPEREAATVRTGASPSATLAEMRAGLDTLQTSARAKISNFGSARPEWADETLRAGGLDPERDAPGIKRKPKTAAAAGGNDEDPELGPGERLVTNEEGDEVVEGGDYNPYEYKGQPSMNPGEDLTLGKGPKVSRGGKAPKQQPAAPQPSAEPGMINVIVRGKPRTISEEQAQWLVRQGVEVLPQ